VPAPLVYVEDLGDAAPGESRALARDDDHHLRTVVRLRDGDEVVLADGAGRSATGRLVAGGAEVVDGVVVTPVPAPTVEVVHGLPKGRKLDEVVRVLTELGVDAVTPVHADRSPVELRGQKAEKAATRWRAVARSAGAQSRRARLPVVAAPTTLADAVAAHTGPDVLTLVAHPDATTGLGTALRARDAWPGRVVLVVGPESGWSDDEVAAWRAAGAAAVHLGATVLRTEHAAAAACAALALVLGRMD
jgi:16S rRNA (uracil1498-N3)-methyltransferase